MFEGGEGVDWATAEALAFGTLLQDGFGVRLSGQDSRRGTFSQRHAVFIDQETERTYTPLRHLDSANATFEVHDSNLSEFAVMGFEYGYSLANPKFLVLWEGQFGDFANGAQVIIDQFISSGERKWLRLVRFSFCSCRTAMKVRGRSIPRRALNGSCSFVRRTICRSPTARRRQTTFTSCADRCAGNFRKPLVLMTPKSLLRHKRCVSSLEEMGPGSSFHRVLWDDAESKPGATVKLVSDAKIKRVVLCSGKVYYDLLEEREKRGV